MEDKILEKYEKMLVNEGVLNEGTTLTKKHFIGLAGGMKNAKTLDDLKNYLVDWCATLNPQFDSEKFKTAAGMK